MSASECMFCGETSCDCAGTTKKKAPAKRAAPRKKSSPSPAPKPTRRIKPRVTGEADVSVSASDRSNMRLDAETLEAVKMLAFTGILAESEKVKWADQIEPKKATGKLIEGGEQWSKP